MIPQKRIDKIVEQAIRTKTATAWDLAKGMDSKAISTLKSFFPKVTQKGLDWAKWGGIGGAALGGLYGLTRKGGGLGSALGYGILGGATGGLGGGAYGAYSGYKNMGAEGKKTLQFLKEIRSLEGYPKDGSVYDKGKFFFDDMSRISTYKKWKGTERLSRLGELRDLYKLYLKK